MIVQQPKLVSLLISLASVVLIISGLRTLSGLLTPILLSLFLVLVAAPLVTWLRKKGLPRWIAYLVILLGVGIIGLFFTYFLTTSLNQLLDVLPSYSDQIESQVDNLLNWLGTRGIDSADIRALSWFQPERILQVSVTVTTTVLGTLSNVGLTLVIFVYMLATAPSFSARLRRGLRNNPSTLQRLQSFAHSTSAYLSIKGWIGALTALDSNYFDADFGTGFCGAMGSAFILFELCSKYWLLSCIGATATTSGDRARLDKGGFVCVSLHCYQQLLRSGDCTKVFGGRIRSLSASYVFSRDYLDLDTRSYWCISGAAADGYG